MGTLYWQLNDTWPVVSWSSRDYFGRWKALHYAAREAFAPLLLSPVLEGSAAEIWGVSDLLTATADTLHLELLDFDGTVLWQAPVPTILPPNSSTLLWERDTQELLGDADPRRTVLTARMGNGEALLYFRRPGELELEAPAIHMELEPTEGGFHLTLLADRLAKDVYLTLEEVRFQDNFFDLLPNRPRGIRLETELSADAVRVPQEGMEVGG
jgi:beta-mannosidase